MALPRYAGLLALCQLNSQPIHLVSLHYFYAIPFSLANLISLMLVWVSPCRIVIKRFVQPHARGCRAKCKTAAASVTPPRGSSSHQTHAITIIPTASNASLLIALAVQLPGASGNSPFRRPYLKLDQGPQETNFRATKQ